MSRRSHSLRSSAPQPSYFSRPSRGVAGHSCFERRFVPGAIAHADTTATVLPFGRPGLTGGFASGIANGLPSEDR